MVFIQPLFYLAGICVWQYFADCLNKTSDTFIANAYVFGKVYFPRLVEPLANVTSNLVRFGIRFLLTFLVQLWMCAMPVICPLSTITNGRIKLAMMVNPVTGIVEAFENVSFDSAVTKRYTYYRI